MNFDSAKPSLEAINKLLQTMQTLRGPKGCEWDREQNPHSLKKYILEEAYEVIDAIDRNATEEICEELGDLLLQIIFQAQIFQEEKLFGMAEIANSINNKLIRRHPHIFASTSPDNREFDWERIKQEERKEKGQPLHLDGRIPQALPALKRAEKLVSTLNRVTQSAASTESIYQQIMKSLPRIIQPGISNEDAEQTLGNVLYQLTALGKSLHIDAEDALRQSVDRRIKKYDKGSEG
jgi:MazG family protein